MTPYNLYEELKKKKERYEFKDAILKAKRELTVSKTVDIFVTDDMIKSSYGYLDYVKTGTASYTTEGIVIGDGSKWKKYRVTVRGIKDDDDLIGYAVRVIRCCFCGDFYF